MVMTSSSPEPVYTNGRLRIDADMAFDILDAVKQLQARFVVTRAECRDEGLLEAAGYYDERLKRLDRLRRRVNALVVEKDWGAPDDGRD